MSNLQVGQVFTAKLPVFTGKYPDTTFSHSVLVTAKVTKIHQDKKPVSCSFLIKESSDPANFTPGQQYRRHNNNVLKNITEHQLDTNKKA